MTKVNADNFDAFQSPNYPVLAKAGVNIKYKKQYVKKASHYQIKAHSNLSNNVSILKLFPSIRKEVVISILNSSKGIILETFGSGNAMSEEWFLRLLKQAIDKGIVIVNVTQCKGGGVDQSKYESGNSLEAIGVISGGDITFEAAITKLMLLLGGKTITEKIKRKFLSPFCGEIS